MNKITNTTGNAFFLGGTCGGLIYALITNSETPLWILVVFTALYLAWLPIRTALVHKATR